jgi:hypothetical protein
MTHDVTVFLTAAWRLGEQRGPLRYSAATGNGYGTPNCETFWEAVGHLVRLMAWEASDAAHDAANARSVDGLAAHTFAA